MKLKAIAKDKVCEHCNWFTPGETYEIYRDEDGDLYLFNGYWTSPDHWDILEEVK